VIRTIHEEEPSLSSNPSPSFNLFAGMQTHDKSFEKNSKDEKIKDAFSFVDY